MRAFSHLRVLLAALLAVALLGACGGDDDDGGDTALTTTTEAEADAGDESTTSEPTEDTTDTSTDDTTEDTTDTSTDDTTDDSTDPSFEGDADSEWCGYYRVLDEMPDLFGSEASTPEQVEEQFSEALLVADQLVDEAPDEIAEQTAVVAGAFQELGEILERYDWDFVRFSEEGTEEEFALLENPELEEASTDVEAYASQVCGIG